MCTSASTTFAWVGAILVNFGYITLIAWGSSTQWPLGFTLCGLYALILFGLANRIYRKEGTQTLSFNRPLQEAIREEEDQALDEPLLEESGELPGTTQSQPDEPSQERTISVLVSLLFGLAVIAMAVTGSFLPVNLLAWSCDDGFGWQPQLEWTTNVSALPEGVQAWAEGPYEYQQENSFGYLVNVEITCFSGYEPSTSNAIEANPTLWISQSHGPPLSHPNIQEPTNFIAVSDSTLCFQARAEINHWEKFNEIHCTDGSNVSVAIDPDKRQFFDPYKFSALDGILWAKVVPGVETLETGVLIYSMDPSSMELELHSIRVDVNNQGRNCRKSVREDAAMSLFVVALPVLLVSMALWRSKQIPSMGVTAVLGLHLIYAVVNVLIRPKEVEQYPRWDWWFAISGGLLILVLSYYILTGGDDQLRKGPKRWALVVCGMTYMGGTYMLLFDGLDTLSRWFAWNCITFIPLIIVGASTGATFLMFLGALGFLIDSARLAEYVGGHVSSDVNVPVQFLVFSLSGILVGGLGILLNNHQPIIEEKAEAFVKALNERCARRSVAPIEETNEDFADINSPMLHPDENYADDI